MTADWGGNNRGRIAQRGMVMESTTKNRMAGTSFPLQSRIKEVAGMISDCPKRNFQGTAEAVVGENHVKIGSFNNFWGK